MFIIEYVYLIKIKHLKSNKDLRCFTSVLRFRQRYNKYEKRICHIDTSIPFSKKWWSWGELNPRPKALERELLRAQTVISGRNPIPYTRRKPSRELAW